MGLYTYKIIKNIVACSIAAMFFSCMNSSDQVRELLSAKNLPVGITKDIVHVYRDSGITASKMFSPLMYDFSNRTEHPYNKFPKGLKLISFENSGKDSVTILGDYALTYSKTKISELKGNVTIFNHTDKSKLVTEQLFWDQNTDYFYSEKKFQLTTPTDTINGVGFESKKDLSKFLAKQMSGQVTTTEN